MDFSSVDMSGLGEIRAKGAAKTPFSVGLTTSQALIADEQSRLAAREAAGMPTAKAAMATGAAIGTAGATGQASLADRLKAIAGGGPTAGTAAAYDANKQAKAGLYASAFANPGAGGAARALRTTGNQGALMDAQTARQADLIRAQEQQAALQQYAQLGTTMRSGDMAEAAEQDKINLANAGFANQSALANQQAALKWQAMNDAQKRALLGMGIDLSQNDYDNRLNYYGALQGNEMDWINARKQAQAAGNARDAQLLMTAVTFGAGGMTSGATKGAGTGGGSKAGG